MRWIRPVSRSEAKNWRVALSKVTSPMPGPLLASIVANSETAPETPSIFQMAPGLPPLFSANWPVHEGGAGLAVALPLGAAVAVFVGRHDAQAVQRRRARVEVRHAGVARRRARRRHRSGRRPGRSAWPAPRTAAACRRAGRTAARQALKRRRCAASRAPVSMKVSSIGSMPGGRPSSMPGMIVPEKPETAIEPGWMTGAVLRVSRRREPQARRRAPGRRCLPSARRARRQTRWSTMGAVVRIAQSRA